MQGIFGKLWRHGLVYTAGAVAGKAASFLMLPIYTRYLPTERYGVLQLVTATTEVCAILLGLGLSSALIRYWSKYDDPGERRSVVRTALGSLLLVSAAGVALALVLSQWLAAPILGGRDFLLVLQLQFVATFFEMTIALPMDSLRVRERSKLYVWISFLRSIANMGLTIYLLAVWRMGLLGVVWANVIVGGLAAVPLFVYALRLGGGLRVSRNRLREMLAYGLPLVPAGIALWALPQLSLYFLKAHRGLELVGLFGMGRNVAALLAPLITAPFAQVWGWLMFDAAKRPNADKLIARALSYYVAVATFAAVVLSALAHDVLRLMATPEYLPAYTVVPLLTLGYVLYGAEWVTSSGLCIRERTRYRAYVVAGAALLCLALNAILVRPFGIQGAAMAVVLSYGALLLATATVANRVYPVNWEVGRVVHALVIAALLATAALGTITRFPELWPGVPIRLLIAASFPVLLLVTGFFTRAEIASVRRRRDDEGRADRAPRVLMINNHFPPDIQVASHRPTRFAKYLTRLGWDVWVLTLPEECFPAVAGEVAADVLPPGRVVRVRPWRRVGRRAEGASEAGDGTGRPDVFTRVKAWAAATVGMRMNELLWVLPASRVAARIILEHDIDIIFSSCAPFTCHLTARAAQRSTGRPWVADYHDPWSSNPWFGGQARWQRLLRAWIERRTVRHADHVTIVNEMMRQYVLDRSPYLRQDRTTAITLAFDPDEFSASREIAVPRSDGRMVVTYTGSLTSYRSPEPLLDGLALAVADGRLRQSDVELRFMGIDDMGDGRTLGQMVREKRLESAVTLYGTVPYREALAYQLASDVLVYLQTKKGGGSIFASAKLYEYLGTGLPILAICEESMATALLREGGGAIVVNPESASGVADALVELHATWRRGDAVPEPRRKVIEMIREPAPTQRLSALMSGLISRPDVAQMAERCEPACVPVE